MKTNKLKNSTMKKLKFIFPTVLATLFLVSCGGDDDAPEEVNEEEVITTVNLSLTSDAGNVTMTSVDLDGDGPNPPVVEVSGNLKADTMYNGTVQFLNQTETPAENITLEVVEEADEHQVFYIAGGGLNVETTYGDFDGDNNPLGTILTLNAGAVSNGTLNVTLRHEPTKPNDGTLAGAGGETDVSVTFNVTIEE